MAGGSGDSMEVDDQQSSKAPAPVVAAADEPEEEEEEVVVQIPDMEVAQACFVAVTKGDQASKDEVMKVITEKSMAPWYASLCQLHPSTFTLDRSLLDKLTKENEAELAKIEEDMQGAIKDAGDMEVLDAMFAKASCLARIGDKDGAYKAYTAILEKEKISTGKKIDACMAKIRVGLFHVDMEEMREGLDRCKKLVETGGDWDRRNRLKVYEALFLVIRRDITGAAALLLECVATFTCTELCSYEQFVKYAVITNILSLPRTSLKQKIIDGPEVLSVMPALPSVQALVTSLYECDYKAFLHALVTVHTQVVEDRYFSRHATYLVRELRILAYTQFLEAYKSVILESMATQFGVSVPFLDKELSRFIAAGRLNAKIDKVSGVVETNRPDSKNAQYLSTIKEGDLLLNKVQKLARVIDV